MMNPTYYTHSNTEKHGDDQLIVFSDNNDQLLVSIVCDGVSDSSCGHIAASFMCYYIRQFFKENFSATVTNEQLKTFASTAIRSAVDKLTAFAARITIPPATPIAGPVDELPAADISLVTGQEQEPASPEKSSAIVLYENTAVTVPTGNPVWEEYKMICEDLRYKQFAANVEKISRLLEEGAALSFACTLSLNLLYPTSPGWWEVLSINYGDTEFYVVTWDESANKITAFLPHYKIMQEALRSYISSEDDGIKGTPVILTRNISVNDTILLATDGAYIHYTTAGGFPYEPFKKRFANLKADGQALDELPLSWFRYLEGHNAINDDFSLVIIELTSQTAP